MEGQENTSWETDTYVPNIKSNIKQVCKEKVCPADRRNAKSYAKNEHSTLGKTREPEAPRGGREAGRPNGLLSMCFRLIRARYYTRSNTVQGLFFCLSFLGHSAKMWSQLWPREMTQVWGKWGNIQKKVIRHRHMKSTIDKWEDSHGE